MEEVYNYDDEKVISTESFPVNKHNKYDGHCMHTETIKYILVQETNIQLFQ